MQNFQLVSDFINKSDVKLSLLMDPHNKAMVGF